MAPAGIALLQLAVPPLRQDRGLRAFNEAYGPKCACHSTVAPHPQAALLSRGPLACRHKYDLDAWRASSFIPAADFQLLDAEQGAGGLPGAAHGMHIPAAAALLATLLLLQVQHPVHINSLLLPPPLPPQAGSWPRLCCGHAACGCWLTA